MPFHAVILAGGAGIRFWPLSRRGSPKQVLALDHGRPLIASALERVATADCVPWVCCSKELEGVLRAALGEARQARFILEPEPRNTTACIALAAARVLAETDDEDTVLAFLPADHVVEPVASFRAALDVARRRAASSDAIVVIGIEPTRPATGYGYIEQGERVAEENGVPSYRVRRFREKPSQSDAAAWIESGRFSWNGGFVVARIGAILAALESHAPATFEATLGMRRGFAAQDESAVDAAFRSIETIAFDYAVLEKARNLIVVRGDFRWNDLGGFSALAQGVPPDGDDNRTWLEQGLGAFLLQSKNTFIVGRGDHLVATLGVSDLVVVHTEDVTLVCSKERLDEIRELVAEIRRNGRTDVL